ncbi:ATPase family associated with various cellular activities (AAA) [Paraburkholderia phenazinium]|jgi:AAA+ superfamily predicted ATPase|uniref:ATPase family associated with various cellular activities (AAA) n=1 Tax=Paraburkholderia phenazinium TaxID=60549 RepID=A0A1G8LX95_9BURK|nr:ATP-binding protein [Paraburkholderia phenazinium]SDI13040.1 ATPase family associated with various cellular activities (AAA) [Paraburkholderia phenazinium]SDI60362.1 ATPase family associated with various cellular activities (AAA) [Paraburkholderia phenazinium]
MAEASVFDVRVALPDSSITARAKTLLGFEERYTKVRNQLRLLLSANELEAWSKKHYGTKIPLVDLVKDQYPLVIFHGDVGTGKTAMAEAISNRLVAESKVEDSELFKLSSRVRGTGAVGEMGGLISDAFAEIGKSCGKTRRAVLIVDEADSLGASRSQQHSHHEDKVAVNTLIQSIDELRKYGGRVVVFFCTNRIDALDPAILRRAALVEEFSRPDDAQRKALFEGDLDALGLKSSEIATLVSATAPQKNAPGWTYSDIRTRLYPAALALAFPDHKLKYEHISSVLSTMKPSPVLA